MLVSAARGTAFTVDLHAHALIQAVEPLVRNDSRWSSELAQQVEWNGEASTRHNLDLLVSRYLRALTDLDARVAAMDKMGVDIQAVSPSPTQYYYWADSELAERIVQVTNEGIAELCAKRPDRLVGLGTVSLQHPELAAEQLRYAVRELGLRGIEISTRAGELELGDEKLGPLWRAAEETEAVVFIHPLGCPLGKRLDRHYLANVVGQPLETTIALSHLIFSGTLDRHPRLTLVAAHGGGYLPQYIGRSDHAALVRPECRELALPPSQYLQRLYYDTLVHDELTLRHLIERVGVQRLVVGTDYPFDMGVTDPVAQLQGLRGISLDDQALVRGGTAARLLKLDRTE